MRDLNILVVTYDVLINGLLRSIASYVLFCSLLMQLCTVLYYTVLYYTVLYCTVLYCTVLYRTMLYCSALVLYCTVLYWCFLQPGGLKAQMQKNREAVKLFQEALTIDPSNKMATSGLEKTMSKK